MKLIMKYLCPYCERVELGLHVRKIPAEMISVESQKNDVFPENLASINPNKTFPTLLTSETSGFAESLIILEYLDSLAAPGRKLYGNNAEEVAQTKFSMELAAPLIAEALREGISKYGLAADTTATFAKVKAAFDKLNSLLECRQSPYLGGNEWNVVDLHIIPFVVKYAAIARKDKKYPIPSKDSLAEKYFEQVVSHPLVKAHLPSADEITEHAQLHNMKKGTPVGTMKGLSRDILEHVEERVHELNVFFQKKAQWTLDQNERGTFISALFPLKGISHALNALKIINEVQEKTNHHCHFVLQNFETLRIELCTHEPKYGVTALDFAFAQIITEKLI